MHTIFFVFSCLCHNCLLHLCFETSVSSNFIVFLFILSSHSFYHANVGTKTHVIRDDVISNDVRNGAQNKMTWVSDVKICVNDNNNVLFAFANKVKIAESNGVRWRYRGHWLNFIEGGVGKLLSIKLCICSNVNAHHTPTFCSLWRG